MCHKPDNGTCYIIRHLRLEPLMVRWRRQNFVSLPQVLSSVSENTHWNLSATKLSCPWSIWDSFRCLTSNTSKRSFGWIIIKIHNKIKYLKVITYVKPKGCQLVL